MSLQSVFIKTDAIEEGCRSAGSRPCSELGTEDAFGGVHRGFRAMRDAYGESIISIRSGNFRR